MVLQNMGMAFTILLEEDGCKIVSMGKLLRLVMRKEKMQS